MKQFLCTKSTFWDFKKQFSCNMIFWSPCCIALSLWFLKLRQSRFGLTNTDYSEMPSFFMLFFYNFSINVFDTYFTLLTYWVCRGINSLGLFTWGTIMLCLWFLTTCGLWLLTTRCWFFYVSFKSNLSPEYFILLLRLCSSIPRYYKNLILSFSIFDILPSFLKCMQIWET